MIPLDIQLATHILTWVAQKVKSKILDGNDETNYYIPSFDEVIEDTYYTGVVTEIKGDTAFLGTMYSFCTTKVDKDVFVGSVVTCILSKNSLSNGLVDSVNVIDIIDNKAEDIEEVDRGTYRTGVISARDGNVFIVNPGPLQFDIAQVKVNFLPEVMDIIKMHIKSRINPDTGDYDEEVLEVIYVGYRTVTGRISWFEDGSGLIDDIISFEVNHCLPGYSPSLDDQVVVSAVRCQRGSTKYRAIDIRPVADPEVDSIPALFEEIVLLPKEIIRIEAEVERTLNAFLHNTSSSPYILKEIVLLPGEHSAQLLEPTKFPIAMNAQSKITLVVKVTVKYIGFSCVKFELLFDSHVVEVDLKFLAESSQVEEIIKESSTATGWPKIVASKKKTALKSDLNGAIPGRRFYKTVNFVPVKMGSYYIPQTILKEFESGEYMNFNKIQRCIPCLQTGLRADNYAVYMHSLLYLEEVSVLQKVSRLEVTSSFSVQGDFLCLYVEEDSLFTSILHSGDKVIARTPWSGGPAYEGLIWHFTQGCMMIKFRNEFHSQYTRGAEYRLTFEVGRSVFRLKHQAVDDAIHRFGVRWLFPVNGNFSHQTPFVTLVNAPMDQLSSQESFVSLPRKPKWNRSGSGYGKNQSLSDDTSVIPVGRVRQTRWFNSRLNQEQRAAVEAALKAVVRPNPYIIFGPPGTGKSFTLVELVLQIYHLIPESRLIVTAQSNSASDLLALALIGSGFIPEGSMVRLCGFRYASSGSLPLSLAPISAVADMKCSSSEYISSDIDTSEIPRINRDTLATKRVIIGTLPSVGAMRSMGFPRGYISHVILDEAAHVTEPEALIVANMLGQSGVMVIAGDHMQLGPVVQSSFASRYGLSKSLMERFMAFRPYSKDMRRYPDSLGYDSTYVTKLVKSYRSLPAILHIPNKLFYDEELISMVDANNSREADIYSALSCLYPKESTIPVVFHSVKGQECTEVDSFSFYNLEEVYHVVSFLVRVYQSGVKSADVGIITPYAAQAKKLQKFISQMSLECPKIGSVEEFQGQERDIIILSTVRSSSENLVAQSSSDVDSEYVWKNLKNMTALLGFVSSPKRINVALTRARAGLIVVGDYTTLSQDEVWRAFISYCISNKSFIQ